MTNEFKGTLDLLEEALAKVKEQADHGTVDEFNDRLQDLCRYADQLYMTSPSDDEAMRAFINASY